MRKTIQSVVAIWIACFVFCVVSMPFMAPPVKADTGTVYVKWYVPYVTTIAVAYPTGIYEVRFNLSSSSCTNLSAAHQNATLAAFQVTNNGNTAINISCRFNSSFPTGVTGVFVNLSDGTGYTYTYTTGAAATNQTLKTNLASGGSQGFWMKTTGSGLTANPWSVGWNRSFFVYSVAYATGA